MRDRFMIVAPPPTPNGGLHVGHLSGPYLAADIFKRECLHRGFDAYYALSTDDHQSYVDTRAARLGATPAQLIASARRDIARTIEAFAIAADIFGQPGGRYDAFVADFFRDAHSAGLIDVVDTPVLYDARTGTYPVEAFVKGYCPHCLARSCGGICESCGRPNDGVDLLPIDAQSDLAVRTEPRLSVDLEASRGHLVRFFERCAIANPKLRALVAEHLKAPLGRFTLSYHAERGVPVGIAGLGDQKLNVWGEMYPGHFYHLLSACPDMSARDRYIQCFGYDNSYFYVILHSVLGDIARKLGRDWPAPDAFIVNRFYNLGYEKFSTSNGHAIWANDWVEEHDPDLLRFFLALHGPEHDEASFLPAFASERIGFLGGLINRLAAAFDDAETAPDGALRYPLDFRTRKGGDLLEASMHSIAASALAALTFLDDRLAAGDREILPQIPLALKTVLVSLCPVFAEAIAIRPGCTMPRMSLGGQGSGQHLARADEPRRQAL